MEIDETESESNILYDVVTLEEWHQNSDTGLQKISFNNSISTPSSYFNPWRIFEKSKLENIKFLQNGHPWQLAVSNDGKVMAIVQDSLLEIRTAKDQFSAVAGKALIPADQYPQLRKVSWSTDDSCLAVARDNGFVMVFNLLGCVIATVMPFEIKGKIPKNNTNIIKPVTGLIFLPPRVKSTKWSNELYIFYHDSEVRSILLSSVDGCDSVQNANCSLERYFPQGITSVTSHGLQHNIVIAGNSPSDRDGITIWTVVNDNSYLKIASGFEEDIPVGRSFLRFFQGYSGKLNQSAVIKMRISPRGQILACIHYSGDISLWQYPGVKLIRRWALSQQPNYNETNPRNSDNVTDKENFYPVDICWWSDAALVIARKSGAVTVCSLTTLNNLLGKSPEFLCSPQISSMNGQKCTVLALECEIGNNKNKMRDELENTKNENENETSVLQATIQAALYSFTDIERFQPKRKTPRVMQRTYRLRALKYATPEQLYLRKIELEDYDSALSLARTFKLDCDLVYQNQWKSSAVNKESIYNYLDKIKNKYWVVNECLRRVPNTIQSAKELLEFGLKITDKARGSVNYYDFEQKQLIPLRRQILSFLDNLTLYQKIINNPSKYNAEEYDKIRRKSPLMNAVDFARQENWLAVSIFFTYKGNSVLKYWLPILSNFPETLCPLNYRCLLPEIAKNKVVAWNTHQLRSSDWSEDLENNEAEREEEVSKEYIYHSDRTLKQYEAETIAPGLLARWYLRRVYEIERNTGLVENAYLLACLGKERNVKSLETVLFHLRSLYTLVYTVQDFDITLSKLESLSPSDQAKLFMSNTTTETFIKDLNSLFYPFAKRCENRGICNIYSLIHSLLLSLVENNLDLALLFFIASKEENVLSFKLSTAEIMRLAIRCIYSCKKPDQLENNYAILECLPARTTSESIVGPDLHNTIDKMENHLQVCEILQQYKIYKPLIWVVEHTENRNAVRHAMQQMANYARDVTSDFTSLQYDLKQVQSCMLASYDTQFCYELIASTQLNATNERTILLAKNFMQSNRTDPDKKISFESAVELVVIAAKRHFERAHSFDDPAIQLARTCLSLIQEPHTLITEQFDFIEGLQILKDFGLKVLPMQVRTSRKRIIFIERCLEEKPYAYKSQQRLLQLADALRVHGSDQNKRECSVIILLAKHALKMNDYDYCHQMCNQLMDKNYPGAWSVVCDFAQANENLSTQAKQDLLAFAILHCPKEQLRNITELRRNAR